MGLGLVQKFKLERNKEPFPPHEGKYFVLFPEHDEHARDALYTYAASISPVNPELCAELKGWLERIDT